MSARTEAVLADFKPPIGIRTAHMQSILGAWSLRGQIVRYRTRDFVKTASAELIHCEAGVRLLAKVNNPAHSPQALVVLLHGWEGSADATYVVSAAHQLRALGCKTVRLNFRDHGGTCALNEGLFHSCRIEEIVSAVSVIQQANPGLPLYLVGFSLGANFALRVAARANSAGIQLQKVLAVCPVLSPTRTMQALEQGMWIYRYYFLRRWRRSLLAKASVFPQLYQFGNLKRLPTLTATTDYFVKHYTEFENLNDYLNGYAITGDQLAGLEVESLLIATADDPVIPIEDTQLLARTDALRVHVLQQGGHCGLLKDYFLNSWLDESIDSLLLT